MAPTENVPIEVSALAIRLPLKQTSHNPNHLVKVAVARRTKPSAKPGNIKLPLTGNLPRTLAEALTAQAISQERSLEGLARELLAHAATSRQ